MVDARKTVTELCDKIEMYNACKGAFPRGNAIAFATGDVAENITAMLDEIEGINHTLRSPEVISQYSDFEQQGFKEYLDEVDEFIHNQRVWLENCQDLHWLDSKKLAGVL